jgi:catechol 2,3-dioxygenase-like lactoylglutathione lyase family enzyme
MTVSAMNHFTILTEELEATLAFYDEHLNLRPGPRPPFTFPGAWLYADGGKGSEPILHIIAGRDKTLIRRGVIDHMAFTGHGLAAAVEKLKAKGVPYQLRKLPDYGTWQLFFDDPNGATVEIDFDKAEPPPAGYEAGATRAARPA